MSGGEFAEGAAGEVGNYQAHSSARVFEQQAYAVGDEGVRDFAAVHSEDSRGAN